MAAPSELRLDDTYVVLYVNIARLLVQGIIPFVCLSFLNYRIYWVMRRRSQLVNRPQITQQTNGVSTQQKKANEAQQAVVLFVIVLLFFFCHTLRFILNIHEFLTLETLRTAIKEDCNSVSLWALGGASISHCLMTLNSSVNFFIYAFTSSTFRDVLTGHIKRFTPKPIMAWIQARKAQNNVKALEKGPPTRAIEETAPLNAQIMVRNVDSPKGNGENHHISSKKAEETMKNESVAVVAKNENEKSKVSIIVERSPPQDKKNCKEIELHPVCANVTNI